MARHLFLLCIFLVAISLFKAIDAVVSHVLTAELESSCGTILRPATNVEAVRLVGGGVKALQHNCIVRLDRNFAQRDQKLHFYVREFTYDGCEDVSLAWALDWFYISDEGGHVVLSSSRCVYNRSVMAEGQWMHQVAVRSRSPPYRLDLLITRTDSAPRRGVNCSRPGYQICPSNEYCVHKSLFCDGLINCASADGRQRTDETGCLSIRPPSAWCSWGSWSVCDPSDSGVCSDSARQIRRRRCCPANDSVCPGEAVQSRPCRQEAVCCLQWCPWASWSVCSACSASRTRQRLCLCRSNCSAGGPATGAACGPNRFESGSCHLSGACAQERETWRYMAVVGGACVVSLLLFVVPFIFYARHFRHQRIIRSRRAAERSADRSVQPYIPPPPGASPFNFEVSVLGHDNSAFESCSRPPNYDVVMDNKDVFGVASAPPASMHM